MLFNNIRINHSDSTSLCYAMLVVVDRMVILQCELSSKGLTGADEYNGKVRIYVVRVIFVAHLYDSHIQEACN